MLQGKHQLIEEGLNNFFKVRHQKIKDSILDKDDLRQELYIKLFEEFPKWIGGDFLKWSFTVCENKRKDLLKKATHRNFRPIISDPVGIDFPLHDVADFILAHLDKRNVALKKRLQEMGPFSLFELSKYDLAAIARSFGLEADSADGKKTLLEKLADQFRKEFID